jgi:hypothetical protein
MLATLSKLHHVPYDLSYSQHYAYLTGVDAGLTCAVASTAALLCTCQNGH